MIKIEGKNGKKKFIKEKAKNVKNNILSKSSWLGIKKTKKVIEIFLAINESKNIWN